jgi:hypothetical protein
MNTSFTLDRARPAAKRDILARRAAALLAFVPLFGASAPARAVDGCQVLLCFAAANWRTIPQCVPPIRQVLRDLARGRSFPTCAMAGSGNAASHAWSNPPRDCPPQYTRTIDTEGGPIHTCDYIGAVAVSVNGAPYSRTWWSRSGDTVTEFSPAAKAQLGSWDTRFDDDHAAWLATLPPPAEQAPRTASGD